MDKKELKEEKKLAVTTSELLLEDLKKRINMHKKEKNYNEQMLADIKSVNNGLLKILWNLRS